MSVGQRLSQHKLGETIEGAGQGPARGEHPDASLSSRVRIAGPRGEGRWLLNRSAGAR